MGLRHCARWRCDVRDRYRSDHRCEDEHVHAALCRLGILVGQRERETGRY
uniref:Uncharacterized protein n=1 Tax=uncultured marine virus TaxID=186617 RepID=A0A0F7LAM2_9VIRU|nr:hypothetical protein [uncultured marine virus]